MIIKIPLLAHPKKNNQQIIYKNGRAIIIQSKQYLAFERDCAYFVKKYAKGIDYPVNLKCTFYVNTRHRRDLTNFLNAIQDILVKYGVLADDNYNIVQSVDGSRIIYRRDDPEVIIEITEVKGNE